VGHQRRRSSIQDYNDRCLRYNSLQSSGCRRGGREINQVEFEQVATSLAKFNQKVAPLFGRMEAREM